MAQKAIREYHAKKLISQNIPTLNWDYQGILIDKDTLDNIDSLNFNKYVAKPDQLFGKRGKNGLIFISDSSKDTKVWVSSKLGTKVRVVKNDKDQGIEGILTHFLIEPAVEHTEEYYLAIKSNRESDTIYFSTNGGIDIEENWNSVTSIDIPFSLESDNNTLAENISRLLNNYKSGHNIKLVADFITQIYNFYKTFAFTYLEFNPFVVSNGKIIPLDTVARVDSTAAYNLGSLWDGVEFPKPFGSEISPVEAEVEKLDAKTGASLKLTILNPDGQIWLLTAGGGASVIYADTVADLGYIDQLANYGEYSGNPSTDETEAYCNSLFKAMFKSKAKGKILIIGGGIANFTDIAATFKGIIAAIKKNKAEFINQKIKIFVRRGGPNYRQGLNLIKLEIEKLGIAIEVHGPELHMTRIVKLALEPET